MGWMDSVSRALNEREKSVVEQRRMIVHDISEW